MYPPVPGPPIPPGSGPVAYPGAPYPYGVHPGARLATPYPYAYPYPPPYRPRIGLPRPAAVAAVPGTPFGLALVEVRATASGPAVASLVAGIGSILVAMAVILFAVAGAADGWGPAVAGAFAALASMVGAAAVALGGAGLRRIRASAPWGPARGRGLAVGGLVCGGIGLAITVLTMLVALLA